MRMGVAYPRCRNRDKSLDGQARDDLKNGNVKIVLKHGIISPPPAPYLLHHLMLHIR